MTLITARVSIQQKLPILSTHYPQSFNMCIITYGLIFPDNTDCIPTYNESVIMPIHYSDVTMGATASEMTHISTVCSTVCSGAHQRKHQISSSLAFVRRIHQSPVDFPHQGLVTRKMFPFDDVIMQRFKTGCLITQLYHTATIQITDCFLFCFSFVFRIFWLVSRFIIFIICIIITITNIIIVSIIIIIIHKSVVLCFVSNHFYTRKFVIICLIGVFLQISKQCDLSHLKLFFFLLFSCNWRDVAGNVFTCVIRAIFREYELSYLTGWRIQGFMVLTWKTTIEFSNNAR